ncbi:hypothetical protein [Microbacterium sp. P05]|uniref:hypothetical protein n=1 Tax=Microbacterium sp. P05 TaxID=3366948 RepID=UPI00374568E9
MTAVPPATSRARRRLWVVVAAIVVVGLGVVAYLSFVGFETTARAGTETNICGVRVGVTAADGEVVRLTWSDGAATLAIGDRTRISPACAVEVVAVSGAPDAEADGGGADVTLRGRLW